MAAVATSVVPASPVRKVIQVNRFLPARRIGLKQQNVGECAIRQVAENVERSGFTEAVCPSKRRPVERRIRGDPKIFVVGIRILVRSDRVQGNRRVTPVLERSHPKERLGRER